MALVIASPVTSSPGATLLQALNDYETILSDEDKIQLHSQGVPDVMAALNLATTIDARNSSHRRQCMGPRLITFLESVQQFSSIVDTFVSSHPDIAALVWGGLKLTLLAANNVASYFDKLSTLFMKLGRTCPRFTEFSYLYPTSVRLQKALCEYYAAVVRLCKHSTVSCGKPGYTWFSTALLNPFESKFGPCERELERLAQEIRDEISLASSQTQVHERREAKADRWVSKRLMKMNLKDQEDARNWRLAIDRQKSEKHRLWVLDAFSTYDHQRAYKQARRECVVGTSTWICETLEFKSWMVEPRETLWCHGRLGSGKTILTACAIAYIAERVSPRDVISFFFCRYDDLESLKPRTIFGSIARQLINDLPTEAFHKFDSTTADLTAILDFLKAVLTGKRRYFIFLDGLDECEDVQFKEIVDVLRDLLDAPLLHIKLCFTTRTSVMNWVPLKLQPERHVFLDTAENQASVARDIDNFVNASLEERLRENELQLGDPTLVLKIQDALKIGAQGMFLWVHFQLRTICAQKSDANIIAALDNLPRDLPQTFERILSGITETDDIDMCKRIFLWVAAVKRPLTLEELREAIGIEPLQQNWDSSRFVNDMKDAIACCGNLIIVEEEQQAVHFTHYSVKQYLLSEAIGTSPRPYHIDLERSDAEVGAVCVTYLNFGIFDTQVARTTGNAQSITSIPSMVLKETLPHRRFGNKIALALLQRQHKSSNAVFRPLEEASGDTEAFRRQRIQEQYSFLSYAREYWLEHTKSIAKLSSRMLGRSWFNLINDTNLPGPSTSISWTHEDWNNGARTVTDWIIEHKHCFLAHLMMVSCVDQPEEAFQRLRDGAVANGDGRLVEIILSSGRVPKTVLSSTLPLVAQKGDVEFVKQLISLKADVNGRAISGDLQGRTALQAAAGSGHIEVVEKLLAEGAEINAPASDWDGRTALQAAAASGHIEVVEKLLAEGAEINMPAGQYSGRTALQAAAASGHIEVVEKLLAEGAEINMPAGQHSGRTALQAAAGSGHMEVVKKLLAEGADINTPAGRHSGRTALQAAAGSGHIEVVEKLLAEGAEINAPAGTRIGRTALQAAAGSGHMEVVEKLLAEGAEINAPAGRHSGRTVLQAAAGSGYMEVVEKLLAEGAEINAPAGTRIGRTALQAAAGSGYMEVVEKLLAEGTEINAPAGNRTRSSQIVLQAAAGSGHMEVVEKLLAEGAEINAPASDWDGRTVLQAAAGSGHMEVVEKLLAEGADINAPAGEFGRTALQAAAGSGHMEVVEKLLAEGADINAPASNWDGRTALQAAAGSGYIEVVEKLLAEGAEINAPAGNRTRSGQTVLQAAAGSGHMEVVEKLLAEGADINTPAGEFGRTALQAAAGSGHMEVVEKLLAEGADINAPAGEYNGLTALQAAAGSGHMEVVEKLLAEGANINAPASKMDGRTALQAASDEGHTQIVELLRKKGAKR